MEKPVLKPLQDAELDSIRGGNALGCFGSGMLIGFGLLSLDPLAVFAGAVGAADACDY